MKKILLITILLFCPFLYANPAPFGLEINKTTLQEAKKKYTLDDKGINHYSKGPMYFINKKQLSLDGLKNVLLVFSEKENTLLAVIANFNQDKFDSLNNSLAQKYKLIEKNIPFVGNKYVTYKDDQSLIQLNAPHMSFELEVIYLYEEFYKKVIKIEKSKKEQKKKDELNTL